MTTRLYGAVMALLFSFALFSCGNEGKEPTSVTPAAHPNSILILGTWNLLYTADDDNENGQLDEEEKIFPAADESMTIYFQSDGTGITTNKYQGMSGPEEDKNSFTWRLLNNDTQFEVISTYVDSFYTQYDTSIVDIKNMTEKSAYWESQTTYTYNNDTIVYRSWIELEKL